MIIQKMIADIVLLEDIPSISNAIHMVPANHIPCELVSSSNILFADRAGWLFTGKVINWIDEEPKTASKNCKEYKGPPVYLFGCRYISMAVLAIFYLHVNAPFYKNTLYITTRPMSFRLSEFS